MDWDETGAIAAMEAISREMASTSASLKGTVFEDWPGPTLLPGVTISRLLPMLAICCLTWSVAPPPMVTIVMTAATPITIPRIVRNDRRTFRLIARRASRIVFQIILLYSRFVDP